MKVTMLGCGTSVGVPTVGPAGWGHCDPENKRNFRQRCAVLVEKDDFVILVDAGPDIRNQLLTHGVKKIDAVLITHTHSDHVAGLDDLRPFYFNKRERIPFMQRHMIWIFCLIVLIICFSRVAIPKLFSACPSWSTYRC